MKRRIKVLLLVIPVLFFGLVVAHSANAQVADTPAKTVGCKPSACRGAKTKFGEAKVITEMRGSLIALKAAMEKSTATKFAARSFDIANIVGESDEESLAIIIREVKLIEKEFAEKLNRTFETFSLPDNKAKQVKYLTARMEGLHSLL